MNDQEYAANGGLFEIRPQDAEFCYAYNASCVNEGEHKIGGEVCAFIMAADATGATYQFTKGEAEEMRREGSLR